MIEKAYEMENGSDLAKAISELMRVERWLPKKIAIDKLRGE